MTSRSFNKDAPSHRQIAGNCLRLADLSTTTSLKGSNDGRDVVRIASDLAEASVAQNIVDLPRACLQDRRHWISGRVRGCPNCSFVWHGISCWVRAAVAFSDMFHMRSQMSASNRTSTPPPGPAAVDCPHAFAAAAMMLDWILPSSCGAGTVSFVRSMEACAIAASVVTRSAVRISADDGKGSKSSEGECVLCKRQVARNARELHRLGDSAQSRPTDDFLALFRVCLPPCSYSCLLLAFAPVPYLIGLDCASFLMRCR